MLKEKTINNVKCHLFLKEKIIVSLPVKPQIFIDLAMCHARYVLIKVLYAMRNTL